METGGEASSHGAGLRSAMTNPPSEDAAPAGAALHSARLRCEACGTETPHRILHLEPRAARATVVRGVARCRTCGLSHPFVSQLPATAEVWVIVSEGPHSERRRVGLPADRKLQVGTGVPDSPEPLVIHKIEDRTGRSIPVGRARDLRTVWAVRQTPPFVLFSLVVGRNTLSGRLPIDPDTPLEVGASIRLPTATATIVGLRARERTWRHPGDRFPAREVQRVYARRGVIPPAGSRDWSSERETPSSRASSTSRVARSRSSPGRSR
jgi:uncharacterized Zn finger protein